MRHTAMVVLVGLVAAGCDLFNNALQVQTPSNIPAGSLEVPANAGLLVNSAIGDFECAAGAYAAMSGLITDELKDATQTADRYPYELRTMLSSDRRYAVNDCIGLGVYSPLQTARFSAANVLSLLNGWTVAQVPARDSLIATASAYQGYSLVLLGEGFCTMVVSGLDANREIVYGGEISRDSVFKLAVAAFSDAIAGGNSDIVNMARVGRARAYLDLGQPALARADALLVPAAYVKLVSASGINARRNNRVWQESDTTFDNTSIDSVYVGMNDPRVPIGNKNRSSGTFAAADSIINSFRARGGQGAITSPDSATASDSLFDQRRRELFLEGQHLFDLVRFGKTPSPAAGTQYQGGGVYGTQLCLPLPDVEKQNNPNFP